MVQISNLIVTKIVFLHDVTAFVYCFKLVAD